MIKAAFVASVIGVAGATVELDERSPAVRQSVVDAINAMSTTWKASVPIRFTNATIADVKRQLGTVLPGHEGYEAPSQEKLNFKTQVSAIPESFDVRTNWPSCAEVSGRVRDQSNCGSCWAFGSTEAFNDRYCIKTGDASLVFSAEDTLACCNGLSCGFSMGCNGGQPSGAWKYFKSHGVPTGGDWADVDMDTTCKPYRMQSCAHHVDPPEGMVSCEDIDSYDTPQCTSTCTEENYGTAYNKDLKFAKSEYSVKGVENMQRELMEQGTLSVSLSVYEDFEYYTSGVYQHVSGKYLGGHAIKMIGWGVENGTPYWTCVNSWNKSWGEEGLFRIYRGKDECGIESGVVAGEV